MNVIFDASDLAQIELDHSLFGFCAWKLIAIEGSDDKRGVRVEPTALRWSPKSKCWRLGDGECRPLEDVQVLGFEERQS